MANQSKANHVVRLLAIFMVVMPLMGMKIIYRNMLHDPTEPPKALLPTKTSETSYRNMNLNAIFIKPFTRWAIINGQVYHEGDAVGEYIITNIHVDTVELIDSANNKERLQLVPLIKKRR